MATVSVMSATSILPPQPYKVPPPTRRRFPIGTPDHVKASHRKQRNRSAAADLRMRKRRYEATLLETLNRLKADLADLTQTENALLAEQERLTAATAPHTPDATLCDHQDFFMEVDSLIEPAASDLYSQQTSIHFTGILLMTWLSMIFSSQTTLKILMDCHGTVQTALPASTHRPITTSSVMPACVATRGRVVPVT